MNQSRTFLKRALLLLAGLLSAAAVSAQDFSFAYMADTHIQTGSPHNEDALNCVKDINRNKDMFSFVIIAGDITEFGADHEIEIAKGIFDRLEIPYYIIAGNHDAKWSESGCNTFVKVFGYENFNFKKDGIRFLGCNSGPNMRMAPALVPRETILWLDSLANRIDPAEPVFFINHYPMDTSVLNYTQVLDRLKKLNTQFVMGGHWHQDKALAYEGIPAMIGRQAYATDSKPAGYNVVKVQGATITVQERSVYPDHGKTGGAWYTLRMSNGDPFNGKIQYPRPDFSMNEEYPNVKEVWRVADNTDIGAAAVKNGKYVIYANTAGVVKALNAEDGAKLWEYRTGGKVFSTPAIYGRGDNASVIIGSSDNHVYSLNIKTGKLLWKHEFGKSVLGSPAVLGNRVYVGGSDHTFRALNAKTGKLIWKYEGIKGFIEAKAYADNGQVVIGDWANRLYSFDPDNGKLQWIWTNKKGRMFSPAAVWPVKANGNIMFVTPERVSYGVDAKTGKQLWRADGGRESIGLSPDKSLYYVKTMKDYIFALSTVPVQKKDKDGNAVLAPEKAWTADIQCGYEISPTPITSIPDAGKDGKGLVFIPTDKGNIYAVNNADGSLAWKHKISIALINNIQPVGNNRLLVCTMDGFVTLLEY